MLEIHLYGIFRKIAKNSEPTDDSKIFLPWVKEETVLELIKRIGFSQDDLGEVFINHSPVDLDSPIPPDSRIGLFPIGMHLLCGGQHMKGHGFITSYRKKINYWNQDEKQ